MRLGTPDGLLQRPFSLRVLTAGLIQTAGPPKNPYRQKRIVTVRYEGLGLLKPNRRRPVTAERLIGLGQTNQRVDLLRARGGSLVERRCLRPALDCLLEIAMLIRLAAVTHQTIDRKRLLRREVRTQANTETQGNARENGACHDRLLGTRETHERCASRSSEF